MMNKIKVSILELFNYKQFLQWLKTYGVGFVIYAIGMNVLDEVFLPLLLAYFGHPYAGGLLVLGDLDWLTYPFYFFIPVLIKRS